MSEINDTARIAREYIAKLEVERGKLQDLVQRQNAGWAKDRAQLEVQRTLTAEYKRAAFELEAGDE